LLSLSRRTVTGLISTSGRQFDDWSADYRFFSKDRVDPGCLFDSIRAEVLKELAPESPFVVAMDDTISHKKGRTIPGTSWRRDPMSPFFQANLVWGRQFIQISAVLPADQEEKPGRAIPIDFIPAPTPIRPRRKAPPEEWTQYRRECRARSLAQQGVERLQRLRAKMSAEGQADRPLWVSVDGSYTNGTVLKQLPEQTTLIGRIRRDALLHPPADPRGDGTVGRTRLYGTTTITPQEVLKDPSLHWQTARVFAAGKVHVMRFKTVSPLLWRSAGANRPLRLLVIAPLEYRPSSRSRLLYRHPAFLVCTNPELDPGQVLNAYVSRWDIEVNIRDEKQLLGFDEAQVRTPKSARTAPSFAVAAYSILLLAAARAFGVNGIPCALPPPKWRAKDTKPRASTSDLINHLRFETWGRAINASSFSDFVNTPSPTSTHQKPQTSLASTLFYAQSRA
jgi:hypothetical protein